MANFSNWNWCHHSYFMGHNLVELEAQIATYVQGIDLIQDQNALNLTAICWQVVLNLLGRSENYLCLMGDVYNEGRSLPVAIASHDRLQLHYFYLYKLMLSYLFGEIAQAKNNGLLAEKYLDNPSKNSTIKILYFYQLLTNLKVLNQRINYPKEVLINRVNYQEQKLQKWAQKTPKIYQHKFNLVAAEKAQFLGDFWAAEELYEQAIAGATENQLIQEEALAYELAATFYLTQGRFKIAQTYMKEANLAYTRWGAKAKVEDLHVKYPQLLATPSTYPTLLSPLIEPSHSMGSERLNLETVIQTSQILFSEVFLQNLLESLLKILIENSGAEVGYLILIREEKLFLVAEGTANPEIIKILPSIPLENKTLISHSMIHEVVSTRKTVILKNATSEKKFVNDPYIKTHQPQSILCLPLIHQDQLISIAYLENNRVTDAFTLDRLELLNFLTLQGAIAIEKARLYTHLMESNRTLATKVEEQSAELAIAKQQAEAATQAKNTFLTNMSHELRSPLNAILGFAQLMFQSTNLSPEYQEKARIIHRSGENLLAMINDVLEMAKIESGQASLNKTAFDLVELITDVENMFILKAKQKKLQFLVEKSPNIPDTIFSDQVKLYQVLIHLLNNAFKFTQSGHIILRISEKPLLPNLKDVLKTENWEMSSADFLDSLIYFSVEDTGCGIDSDDVEKIFEPFMQTKAGKKFPGGKGLGLPISRHYVKLMGGEITVKTQLNQGSIFQFYIHYDQTLLADIKKASAKKIVIGQEPNQPIYRILIVDDRPENRQLLIDILDPLDLEIREASHGEETIELWKEWHPDLILMDVQMPVMDGYTAAQKIRTYEKERGELKPVKIVAMTANSFETDIKQALAVGCNDFVRKPFPENYLFEIIHHQIGLRYIFREPVLAKSVNSSDADLLSPATIAKLPSDLVQRLEQATIRLNSDLIETIIAEVRMIHPALAVSLQNLVDEFEHPKLLDLIEAAKSLK